MIAYKDLGNYQVDVYIEDRKAGTILSKNGKEWWYKPKNGMPSEIFKTLKEVKHSLEEE